MDISTLRPTSLSRLRPLRKPTDEEKKQVTRKLEFSYTFKLIRTTVGSIFLAALCSLILEEFNNINTFWFITGILFSAILMLIMINSFASLNIVSFILDKAREGDFDIIDCKILGIGAKFDTLSNKEQAQLQEAINKAVLEDDCSDLEYLNTKFVTKKRKHLANVVTSENQISGFPLEATKSITDKFLTNKDSDFFIARFSYSDNEVCYMEVFAK